MSMVERFGEGQLREFVDWLDENPNGYVWNASKATLHKAKCQHVKRYAYRLSPGGRPKKKVGASKYAIKHCAPTKKELLLDVPEAKAANARCSVCSP
jgi:hypothetical protein